MYSKLKNMPYIINVNYIGPHTIKTTATPSGSRSLTIQNSTVKLLSEAQKTFTEKKLIAMKEKE